jgi:hypothetical protein
MLDEEYSLRCWMKNTVYAVTRYVALKTQVNCFDDLALQL